MRFSCSRPAVEWFICIRPAVEAIISTEEHFLQYLAVSRTCTVVTKLEIIPACHSCRVYGYMSHKQEVNNECGVNFESLTAERRGNSGLDCTVISLLFQLSDWAPVSSNVSEFSWVMATIQFFLVSLSRATCEVLINCTSVTITLTDQLSVLKQRDGLCIRRCKVEWWAPDYQRRRQGVIKIEGRITNCLPKVRLITMTVVC